jgi:hypothetical protein
MNKQILAEQILKNFKPVIYEYDGDGKGEAYTYSDAIAAIVEAMDVPAPIPDVEYLAEQIFKKHTERSAGLFEDDIIRALVEMGKRCMNTPAKEVEAISDSPDVEDVAFYNWLTPKIDKIIELHDQFLKTFPDNKDENDSELKLCIRAGIIDVVRELKLVEAAKEAISVPAQQGVSWIGIRDKLPGIGSKVIGYRPYAHTHGDDTITILKYEGEHNIDLNGHSHGFERSHCVSHWMPLPEPPAAQPLLPSLEEKKEDLVVSDNNSSSTSGDAPFLKQ